MHVVPQVFQGIQMFFLEEVWDNLQGTAFSQCKTQHSEGNVISTVSTSSVIVTAVEDVAVQINMGIRSSSQPSRPIQIHLTLLDVVLSL